MASTRKTTTSKAAAATTTTKAVKPAAEAPPKGGKLPVTSFACGKLSILSLLTTPYDRAGSALIGLEQLDPDEQVPFLKFLEYAGDPLQPLDLTKIVRVSVASDKETGVLALKNISGFAVCRDGDKIVLTLGANNWEVQQEVTETGSLFRVGKLSSTLSCNSPKDNEPLTASFNWRVKDTTAGAVYEWADAPVWLLREENGQATTAQDLRGVMTDGDDLLPYLGLKIVSPEPVWKLCYPNGNDTQEPLPMPLEYDITAVSIKTYTNGTGGPSRVVHLSNAPYDAVSVRQNAASTVDALVGAGKTAFPVGTYKLQIYSVAIEGEGEATKHFVGHQIQQGKAVTLDLDFEDEEDEVTDLSETGVEEQEYDDVDTEYEDVEAGDTDADEQDADSEEEETDTEA